MIRRVILAALATSAALAAPAAHAAQYVSGTRLAGISQFGPVGQSFVVDGNVLDSFGFEIAVANAGLADDAVTFELREGTGTAGAVVASRSVNLGLTTAARALNFYDFDLAGTAVTAGATYTALLRATNARYSLGFGPATGSTADAYAPGTLIYAQSRTVPAQVLTGCGADGTGSACDADFRFTTRAVAAPGAVPEPATWGTMLGGLFAAGHAVRRRRAKASLAA